MLRDEKEVGLRLLLQPTPLIGTALAPQVLKEPPTLPVLLTQGLLPCNILKAVVLELIPSPGEDTLTAPMRDRSGRLIPTGECWCGCGAETTPGNFWQPGHDKKAESAVITLKYGSTKNAVAEFLLDNGFGPGGRNASVEIEEWRNRGGTTR